MIHDVDPRRLRIPTASCVQAEGLNLESERGSDKPVGCYR